MRRTIIIALALGLSGLALIAQQQTQVLPHLYRVGADSDCLTADPDQDCYGVGLAVPVGTVPSLIDYMGSDPTLVGPVAFQMTPDGQMARIKIPYKNGDLFIAYY